MKDKTTMNQAGSIRQRRTNDGLGPNSDIGSKLRALYGAVEEEGIPSKLLDLLEKLDQVEQSAKTGKSE
ncbi:NepR family anti-sigma factor [Devosia sp.]|uniref:NepR family anti-sigma factor n=1 Tax=Devosia sp. TaxID=1871048 RepID=UPI003BAD633B